MYSYRYQNNRLSLKDDFSAERIIEKLNKFSNKLEGMTLITSYDGRQVCAVEISDRYYNFDFAGFCKEILAEVTKYFSPDSYGITVNNGVQELMLVGGEVIIDNEPYKKYISILNSTDKTRALTMSVGLMRNKNHAYSILTTFANKHFKSSLPDKIKEFSDNLINFNLNIDFHIKTIEDLKGKKVSFRDFLTTMMFKKEGETLKPIKTVGLKMRALGQKIMYGERMWDRRNFLAWNCGEHDKYKNYEDFNIDAKILFDYYTEVFKEQDSSVVARETRRIIDALELCAAQV